MRILIVCSECGSEWEEEASFYNTTSDYAECSKCREEHREPAPEEVES